jgi:hypothetical protein
MDIPKLQNMDLQIDNPFVGGGAMWIDNPFVGGGAMWQSLNPPTQKAKKPSIQKEEENGGAVVDSEEVVGTVAGAPDAKSAQVLRADSDVRVALVPGEDTHVAPDAEALEITAEDFTLVTSQRLGHLGIQWGWRRARSRHGWEEIGRM